MAEVGDGGAEVVDEGFDGVGVSDEVGAEGSVETFVGGGDGGVEELGCGAGEFGDAEDRAEVFGGEGCFVGVGEVKAGEKGALGRAAGLLRVGVEVAGGSAAVGEPGPAALRTHIGRRCSGRRLAVGGAQRAAGAAGDEAGRSWAVPDCQ
ncbi:hypothetical protein [Streptomyces similanensis]|uniref:hypothetical protein n=1 Tax=Streptomyces similanensis TaxID=1274988 RepID=UPI0031F0D9C7